MSHRVKLVGQVADRLARLASLGLPGDEPGLDLESVLADIPDADRSAILSDAGLLAKNRIAEWLEAVESAPEQGTGKLN